MTILAALCNLVDILFIFSPIKLSVYVIFNSKILVFKISYMYHQFFRKHAIYFRNDQSKQNNMFINLKVIMSIEILVPFTNKINLIFN